MVLVSQDLDSQQILRSIRAGADEFVHPPWEQNLTVALQRLAAAVDPKTDPQNGKVIAFLSAKGGCGATTLACHVATNLHRRTGKSVLLADLDLTSGMVDFLMKTHTTYSILDATQNVPRLDASLWKALATEVKSGLSVIPAPVSFAYQQSPEHDDLCATIRFMRTQHDWVVLDLGRSLNSVASTVYNEVDQIFLVSVLEVIALHGLRNIVRRLTEWGQDLDKLQLILNRAPKDYGYYEGRARKYSRPISLCGRAERLSQPQSSVFTGNPDIRVESVERTILSSGRQDCRRSAGEKEKEVCGIRMTRPISSHRLATVSEHMTPIEALPLAQRPRTRPAPGQGKAENAQFEYLELKFAIHKKLLDRINLEAMSALAPERLRPEVRPAVARLVSEERTPLSLVEKERLIDEVLDEVFGLGPLEPLLRDRTSFRHSRYHCAPGLCRTSRQT